MHKPLPVIKWLLLIVAIPLIHACSEPNTGPADVKWDRDACERCRMMLSDRSFSAQIRVFPEGKRSQVKMFDDIGCATLWLSASEWKDDEKTEIWVRSQQEDRWLDAKKAWYARVKFSPMGYGLGAHQEKTPGALNFEQAKQHIVEVEKKFNVHGGNYHH